MDHFQAICEIEFNSHTKSYKSHPKLGPPVLACSMEYFIGQTFHEPKPISIRIDIVLDERPRRSEIYNNKGETLFPIQLNRKSAS